MLHHRTSLSEIPIGPASLFPQIFRFSTGGAVRCEQARAVKSRASGLLSGPGRCAKSACAADGQCADRVVQRSPVPRQDPFWMLFLARNSDPRRHPTVGYPELLQSLMHAIQCLCVRTRIRAATIAARRPSRDYWVLRRPDYTPNPGDSRTVWAFL